MTYYLGRPGALVALPDPEVGLPVTYERVGGMHQLLSGSRVRDTLARMRSWNLSWTAIDLTTFGPIEGLYLGTNGAGGYYFFDPEQRNLLPANVSASGSVTGNTTGFTAGSNVSISVAAGAVLPEKVLLSENTSITTFQTVLDFGYVPVVAGGTYTFSATLNVNGSAPAHYLKINWVDATLIAIPGGAGISFVSSGNQNPGTSGRLTVTGASSTGTAYAGLTVGVASTNTSGSTCFASVEAPQFEMGGAVTTWVPGSDVPLVTVETLSRSTPIAGICDAQMTLTQVR